MFNRVICHINKVRKVELGEIVIPITKKFTNKFDENDLKQKASNQLIHNLFAQSPQTVILSIVVGLILYFGLVEDIDGETPLYWFSFLIIISMLRLSHMLLWNQKILNQQNPIHTTFLLIGAFAGGLTWAALLLFYSESLQLTLQLFIMITLVGMPAASLSTNSIYFPAFVSFSLPQIVATIYWALFMTPGLSIEFTLMAMTYSALLIVTSYRLNRSLKKTITTGLYNKLLANELHNANQELEKLAYIDPLTGIHNRRYFIEKSNEVLKDQLMDTASTRVYLLIDLDKFKEINDTIGHHAGDAYLMATSDRLKSFAAQQKESLIARLGGDEFIISFQISDNSILEDDLNLLLNLLGKPILIGKDVINPSLSIGVAEYPKQATTIENLLRLADKAMYRAKKRGGNQYFLCSSNEQSII